MNKFVRFVFLLPVWFATTSVADTASIRQILDLHGQKVMQQRPLRASVNGLSSEEVGADYQSNIGDYGAEGLRQWRDLARQMQVELRALYGGEVSNQTLNILDDLYDRYQGDTSTSFGFIDQQGRHRPYIINQIGHPLKWITDSLVDYVAVDSWDSAQDYLQRLAKLSPTADAITAKFQADLQAGWIAPRVLRKKALGWFKGYMQPAPASHPLVTSFTGKLQGIEGLNRLQRATLMTQAEKIVRTVVYPAFQRTILTVQASLKFEPSGDGIWAQPGGDAFYRHAIRHEAASDLSATAIHQLGLSEVKRILAEMDALLKVQGYAQGSVGERMDQLSRLPEFLYEDSQAGRAQLLADLNGLIEAINALIPSYFSVLSSDSVEVLAYSELDQDSAPGGEYHSPALDGSRPGRYYINLRNMNERARFTLKTITYHEAVPGHHFQISISRAQGEQPLLQRTQVVSAFNEGWALYAEQLAAEMGAYDKDPYGNLGRLRDELWRAVRLVVDTGLHYKRWSREQAVTYAMAISGKPEINVSADIERYMAWPGQALSYKLGMLEILRLRGRAERVLGEKFDVRAFHDLITTGGAMTMPRLQERVEAWLDDEYAMNFR